MKIEKGSIQLNNKTYEATKVDFDSYTTESGSMTIKGKTYTATKVVGNIGTTPMPSSRTICSNQTICSNTTLVTA